MDKFFLCFGGRPTDGTLPSPIFELSENITVFNLNKQTNGLDADSLKNELLSRGLLYPHNPDLEIRIPKDNPSVLPCWGILIGIEGVENFKTHLYLLELFTGHIFTPIYYIDRLGTPRIPSELFPRYNSEWQGWEDNICFSLNEKFLKFIELFLPIIDVINSDNRHINKWLLENQTERFLFMGGLSLFFELREYAYGKSPVYWLKEALDVGIILEIILGGKPYKEPSFLDKCLSFISRSHFDPIAKTLKTRAKMLVGKKIFSKNTADIVHSIYNYRSIFVHGAFANDIKNSYESSDDIATLKVNSNIFNESMLWQESLRIITLIALALYKENCDGYFGDRITSVKDLLDRAENNTELSTKIETIRRDVLSNACIQNSIPTN